MYCGCASKANRILWAVFALYLALGLALTAGTIGEGIKAYSKYDDCMNGLVKDGSITQAELDQWKLGRSNMRRDAQALGQTGNPFIDKCENDYKHELRTLTALFWTAVVAFIITSVPCYIMCCCAQPPSPTYATGVPTGFASPVTYNGHSNAAYGTPATYPTATLNPAPVPVSLV